MMAMTPTPAQMPPIAAAPIAALLASLLLVPVLLGELGPLVTVSLDGEAPLVTVAGNPVRENENGSVLAPASVLPIAVA